MRTIPFSRRVLVFVAGGFCFPALVSAANEPTAGPAPAAATTHVVYMGADLSVRQDKKFYRVHDVVGSEFMVRIDKKEVFVPTRQRTTGLKVDSTLKLSGESVTLDELQSGPGYSPANDPRLKFDRASGAAAGGWAVQDLAYARLIRAEMAAAGAPGSGLATGGAKGRSSGVGDAWSRGPDEEADAAWADIDPKNRMMTEDRFNTGVHANQMQKELTEGNYDAMEASFKISSPTELSNVYMVALFTFRERDAKPGEDGMLIYAKALGAIGPSPQYVRVREAGLPVGFKFLDCKIHIYNHGEEVATNASANRVELSREDARTYVIVEHIGANKNATVPASVVRGSLPRARRSDLTLDQMNRTYYVKVSAEGVPLAVYADEACQLLVDDEAMTKLLADVLYKPSLVKGKPVEGVARLRWSDI